MATGRHSNCAIFLCASLLAAGCSAPRPAAAPPPHPQEHHTTAPETAPHERSASDEALPLSADIPQVVAWLMEGNLRFQHGEATRHLQNAERRAELTGGQHPHTIVLSCSDSRVPPELVFDQGLGELFTVRTAGEVADPAALGSIEYAVEHLGSKVIVVMGHQACGAVKAALSKDPLPSHNLEHLVGLVRPNISAYMKGPHDPMLNDPVKANVQGIANSLSAKSHIIAEYLHEGKLQIKRALYHLDSGEVEFLE